MVDMGFDGNLKHGDAVGLALYFALCHVLTMRYHLVLVLPHKDKKLKR